MKICFTGVRPLGGVLLRGVQVARALGVPFLDLEREFLTNKTKWDVVVLVKYHRGRGADVRARAGRLIYDPLDCWSSLKQWANEPAVKFWQWTRRELGFDDLLATSPACADVMQSALPTVRIHVAPHHSDPSVGVDECWHDPNGPIVYAGGERFLGGKNETLRRAAFHVGREMVIDPNRCCERSLRGAALAVSLRLPPEDSDLNRHCKPTIKAMNAAAAGLPLLATPDPAHQSQHPGAFFVNEELSWSENFRRALTHPPEITFTRLADHASAVARIIAADAVYSPEGYPNGNS